MAAHPGSSLGRKLWPLLAAACLLAAAAAPAWAAPQLPSCCGPASPCAESGPADCEAMAAVACCEAGAPAATSRTGPAKIPAAPPPAEASPAPFCQALLRAPALPEVPSPGLAALRTVVLLL